MPEVLIELVPESDASGENLSGRSERIAEALANRIEDVGDGIAFVVENLRGQLEELFDDSANDRPSLDAVELSFAFDVTTRANIVIGRIGSRAGFTATVKFKRPTP